MMMLVALLCCSLVAMGTLFWVDNSWALILDSDSATVVNIEPFLDDCVDGLPGIEEDEAEDGVIPIAGGYLISGNGDRDDNKGEEFTIVRRCSGVVTTENRPAFSTFNERRTVAAYKDFGHLKVMPLASDISSTQITSLSTSAKGPPCIAGGLSLYINVLVH